MSTHKITPETKVPFPCWCRGKLTGRWRVVPAWVIQDHPSEAYDAYSTNPPDQRPEEVPTLGGDATMDPSLATRPSLTSPPVSSDPTPAAPSLQSVAEAAARPQHPLCAIVAEQAIGEVKEFAEVLYANGWASPNDAQWTALTKFVNDLKALVRIKSDRHFAPLLTERDAKIGRLEKERDVLTGNLHAWQERYVNLTDAYNKDLAALRTRCAEPEEDKAALDWLEANGHETLAMQYPDGSRVYWVRGFLNLGDFPTLRAAIRAARTKETSPQP